MMVYRRLIIPAFEDSVILKRYWDLQSRLLCASVG